MPLLLFVFCFFIGSVKKYPVSLLELRFNILRYERKILIILAKVHANLPCMEADIFKSLIGIRVLANEIAGCQSSIQAI